MKEWFPILRQHSEHFECPSAIPWAVIAPHEYQAIENHDQTLERLAERGGLSPCEAVAVIKGRKWKQMPYSESTTELKAIVEASKDTELTKLKSDVVRLRTSIRHLLLSADAVWYEKNEGHDWRVAVDEAARALEETKMSNYGPMLELAKLKHETERLLTRSLKCCGHDESCEVEKCDLDRDDDACTCEYKPLVADIEAFLKTVAPKL